MNPHKQLLAAPVGAIPTQTVTHLRVFALCVNELHGRSTKFHRAASGLLEKPGELFRAKSLGAKRVGC